MWLFVQVVGSCLIVAGVLWLMWRLPARQDSFLNAVGPFLSLCSVWVGLIALVGSTMLWWVTFPDHLLVIVLLLLDPASIAAGILALWICRGQRASGGPHAVAISQQRLQASVGVAMGVAAVSLGYIYVMTHKPLFTAVGM